MYEILLQEPSCKNVGNEYVSIKEFYDNEYFWCNSNKFSNPDILILINYFSKKPCVSSRWETLSYYVNLEEWSFIDLYCKYIINDNTLDNIKYEEYDSIEFISPNGEYYNNINRINEIIQVSSKITSLLRKIKQLKLENKTLKLENKTLKLKIVN